MLRDRGEVLLGGHGEKGGVTENVENKKKNDMSGDHSKL